MVLHPEIQEKAQQELDALLKGLRLPTFEDKPALPSVERIVYEVYRCVFWGIFLLLVFERKGNGLLTILERWSPLAPLGVYFDINLYRASELRSVMLMLVPRHSSQIHQR